MQRSISDVLAPAASETKKTRHMNPYPSGFAPGRVRSCGTDSVRPPIPVHPQRILVAEDQADIRHLMSSVLASGGFEVRAAEDGEQAWQTLLQAPFDLLVTDSDMPRLTGLELTERMREAGMHLPVVIASGSFAVDSVSDYPQLRIAAVVLKPFDIGEFLTVVRIALRMSADAVVAGCEKFPGLPASSQLMY